MSKEEKQAISWNEVVEITIATKNEHPEMSNFELFKLNSEKIKQKS